LHVGRQRGGAQRRCARTGSGDSGEGMRREGLKVARCTLHVGRQRGGAQRRCARTGSGDSGEGMRQEASEARGASSL
jgi:hypothetical protein